MARFLRFLAAFPMMPLAWGLVRVLLDSFSLVSAGGDRLFSAEAIALVSGMVVFLVLWNVFPEPVRVYVLGHELTHALWGLFFGAIPSRLRVGPQGGSVNLTKSNVWITLAPYFFPFYTVLVVVLALVVRLVLHFTMPEVKGFPCPPAWTFAVGLTWCFHICFTVRSLTQPQPDVEEYGRLFSWMLILILNLAGILLWLLAVVDIPADALFRQMFFRVTSAYYEVWTFLHGSVSAFLKLVT